MLHSSMVLCRIFSYYTHMPETLECGIKLTRLHILEHSTIMCCDPLLLEMNRTSGIKEQRLCLQSYLSVDTVKIC